MHRDLQKKAKLQELHDAIIGRQRPGNMHPYEAWRLHSGPNDVMPVELRKYSRNDDGAFGDPAAQQNGGNQGSSEFDGPPSLTEIADEVRRQAEFLKSGRRSVEQVADAMTKMADALTDIDQNGYPPSREGAPNPSRDSGE